MNPSLCVIAFAVMCHASSVLAADPAVDRAEEAKKTSAITNSLGMKLVLIPAGEFRMGSPPGETGHSSDEQQHRVLITRPFYLGAHEVTQGQYQRVMRSNPSNFDDEDLPVEGVSWYDTQDFCRKLSQQESRTYRLPTEAEWEYACRAGTTSAFHFGDEPSSEQANYGYKQKRTMPVGSYKPNAFGLYDMHGNVGEWCSDRYDHDYYANSVTENPQGPDSGKSRVFRGGGWGLSPGYGRSAQRITSGPNGCTSNVGFRVVLER